MWLFAPLAIIVVASALWYVRDTKPRPDFGTIIDPPNPDSSRYQSQVAEAIRARRAAVAADPGSAEAWGRLGMVFDTHNLVDEAAACYAEAERIAPTDFRWPYFHAICMPEQDPADIAEALRRAIQLAPQYSVAHVRLGNELTRIGNLDEADDCFAAALELEPTNTHAMIGQARIAFAQRDYSACRAQLEKVVRMRQNFGEAYRLLARVCRLLDQPVRARSAAEIAAALPSKTPMIDPQRKEVRFEGATVGHLVWQTSELRRVGQIQSAIRKARQALSIEPSNANAHWQLGLALFFDLGRQEEGLAALREAVRLAPDHAQAKQALDEALRRVRAAKTDAGP